MDFGGSTEGFTARRSYGPPGGGSNISFGGPVPVGQSYVEKPASSSNPYAATYNKQNEPSMNTGRSHGSPQSYRARQEPRNNGNFLEHQPQTQTSQSHGEQYHQPPQSHQEQPSSQQYQPPPQSYREQPPSQQYQPPPQSYQEQPPSQQYHQPPQSFREAPPSQQFQPPPQSYREQPPSQQYQPPANSTFDVHSSSSANQTGKGTGGGDHQPTGAGSKPSLFLATGRPGQSTGEKGSGQVTRRDMVWEQKRQKFLEKQKAKKEQPSRLGLQGEDRGNYENQSQSSSQYHDPEYMSHSARVQSVSPPSPLSMLVSSQSGDDKGGDGYQNQPPQQQHQLTQGYLGQTSQQHQQQPPQAYHNQPPQQYQQPQGYPSQQQQYQQHPPLGYLGQAPQQQYQQPPQGYPGQPPQQQYPQPPQNYHQSDSRPGSGRRANTGSAIAYGYNDPMASNSGQTTARRGRGAGGGSSQISFG